MRGCVKEVVIAIIMCVIKPSALLAIRITLEHVDGIGCYCMCSGSFGYTMIFHAPQSLFSDLLRTFTHRHFSQKKTLKHFGIWLKRVQTYLYFHSNLTFQFRRIGGIFISCVFFSAFLRFTLFSLFLSSSWCCSSYLISVDWCHNSDSILALGF